MLSRLSVAVVLTVALTCGAAEAQTFTYRLPLDSYPIDDDCQAFGGINPNFERCGGPGQHVADDACAPNGSPVYAVADGVVRFAAEVGSCNNNWGWLTVVEHAPAFGLQTCSIYGHCEPLPDLRLGSLVAKGQHIANINLACGAPHIHFGMYMGHFAAPSGDYPSWLLGYLPPSTTCSEFPVPFPGDYVDPVAFVLENALPVARQTWNHVKRLYR